MKVYDVFSATTIGDSHIRRGIPREDNVAEFATDNYQIVVVSDGHGDPNCFRSAKGAAIACEACIEGLKTFAENILYNQSFRDTLEIEKYRREAIYRLITGIEAKWSLMVQEDLALHPINYAVETEKCDAKKVALFKENKRLKTIYGATLIGAVAFENKVLAIQLGDGKCVFLEADGRFSQPMPLDPRCRGNITTSLCDEDAIGSFRFVYRECGVSDQPVAVILTSDGIEDSYRTDELMYCFHRDVCIQSVARGMQGTRDYFQNERLSVISREGSGDDMSVAALVDLSRLAPYTTGMQSQNDNMAVQEDARYYLERMQSMENKRKYLKRELDKAESEMHGSGSKLLPNNEVITNYQAEKQRCEKQLQDVNSVVDEAAREITLRKSELEALQSKRLEIETALAEERAALEQLLAKQAETHSDIAAEQPETETQSENESAEIVKDKIREKLILAQQTEVEKRQSAFDEMEQKLLAVSNAILRQNDVLIAGQDQQQNLKEEITGLNKKIEKVIFENKHLTGVSASKEKTYAKKKQEWLDYEAKYKSYEAKYNALMKGKRP